MVAFVRATIFENMSRKPRCQTSLRRSALELQQIDQACRQQFGSFDSEDGVEASTADRRGKFHIKILKYEFTAEMRFTPPSRTVTLNKNPHEAINLHMNLLISIQTNSTFCVCPSMLNSSSFCLFYIMFH